tara:strand:- start:195 stop:377 length:183 start_codon:yes stop_codon:yes gene_type:complete
MKTVFIVFECVDFEGEFMRGIYLSREEAQVRAKRLNSENMDPDTAIKVRELEVGVDLDLF